MRFSQWGGCLALLMVFFHVSGAHAQEVYMEHERYGTWEIALHLDRVGGQMVSGITSADLDVDNSAGWGLSLAYNFNNQWSAGVDFLIATPDYQPLLAGAEAPLGDYEMDISSTLFNATWHMRPEGLTPYITLGAGWTYMDSNVASDRPRTDCWWDPWWGYTCSDFYPTYDDSRATVSALAGLRWDFHKRFFTRVSYGKMWIGFDDDNSSPALARIEIGFRH